MGKLFSIRLLVAWAPIVVITFWAVIYLRMVLLTMLSPGLPFTFFYSTPGGRLELTGSSFSIAPFKGLYLFQNLKLYDPSRNLLASVRSLQVRGPSLFHIAQGPFKVSATDGFARLSRDKSGRFQFESFLPAKKNPPSPIAFQFDADRIQALYVDHSTSKPYQLAGTVNNLRLGGYLGTIIGNGQLSVPKIGAAQVHFSSDDDHDIQIDCKVPAIALTQIPDPVKALISKSDPGFFKSYQWNGLSAAGTASIFVRPGSPLTAFGHLTAHGNGLRFQKYRTDQATFNGNFVLAKNRAVWGEVMGKKASTNLIADLVFQPDGRTLVQGSYRVNSGTLDSAMKAAGLAAPDQLQMASVSSSGSFQLIKGNPFSLNGKLVANSGSFQGHEVKDFNALIDLNQQKVRFNATGNPSVTGPIQASGYYALDSKSISASVRGSRLEMKNLMSLAPANVRQQSHLQGPVQANIEISGPIKDPSVHFRVEGYGQATDKNLTRPIALEGLALIGSYSNGIGTIERSWVKTDAGTAWASGKVNVRTKQVNALVDGRALPLQLFDPNLGGLGSLHGAVSGQVQNPTFNGSVETYDPSYEKQALTLAHATVNANLKSVGLTEIQALRGASVLSGNLSLDLKTQALAGELSGPRVWVGDVLGNDFLGSLNANITHIGGTLKSPSAQFSAQGKDLFAQTVPIKSIELNGEVGQHTVSLQASKVDLNSGSVALEGKYNWDKQIGNGAFTSKSLDFGTLAAEALPDKDYRFDGLFNGTGTFAFDQHGLTVANANGTLDKVALNESAIGDGPWNLDYTHGTLTGNVQVSHESTFLSLENVTVSQLNSPEGANIAGTLLANNISFMNLQSALRPLVRKLPVSTQQDFAGSDGLLQTEVDFKGPVKNLDAMEVTIPAFTASNLSRSGTTFGAFSLTGNYKSGTYSIDQGTYTDGTTTGNFDLALTPNKNIQVDGELDGFDLSKLLTFFPDSPALKGVSSLSFVLNGDPANPQLRASFLAQNLVYGDKQSVFGLNLSNIEGKDGILKAKGDLTYNGFVGQVTGQMPFFSKATGPQPILATLALDQRPIQDLQPYFPELAKSLGVGHFGGNLNLNGTMVDGSPKNFALTGALDATGQSMAFQLPKTLFDPNSKGYLPLATRLGTYSLQAKVNNGTIEANLTGTSSKGGSFTGQFSTQLNSVDEALVDPSKLDLTKFNTSPIKGSVTFDKFALAESNSDISTKGVISGALALDGTIKHPVISGDLSAANVVTTIPNLAPSSGNSEPVAINPKFNIKFKTDGVASLKTAVATVSFTGSGSLQGSLVKPDLHTNLAVTSGQFRLPGGVVRLLPGGTVTGTYADNGFGTPVGQLMVDIFGETHVTAAPTPDQIQRYDVSLEIQGDLLDPNNVQITASSDPPDLNQTEILNLLGRTDILDALNGSSTTRNNAFQNALTGYALPTLLQPLTSGLAHSLGLDYLSVEYDQFGQTSVIFGKRLWPGFSLSMRRQISAPLPGFPLYYDYRLNYHPSFLGHRFRSFSFLLGTDQQNLWKIGFQYSTRF